MLVGDVVRKPSAKIRFWYLKLAELWIKGYQSKGLFTTPKHFGGHGAPLGGRDSHDIGLSEREMREIHLVPFRHVIRNYACQSLMMAYSDFFGGTCC